jgi:hypothetical protein
MAAAQDHEMAVPRRMVNLAPRGTGRDQDQQEERQRAYELQARAVDPHESVVRASHQPLLKKVVVGGGCGRGAGVGFGATGAGAGFGATGLGAGFGATGAGVAGGGAGWTATGCGAGAGLAATAGFGMWVARRAWRAGACLRRDCAANSRVSTMLTADGDRRSCQGSRLASSASKGDARAGRGARAVTGTSEFALRSALVAAKAPPKHNAQAPAMAAGGPRLTTDTW